MKVLSLGRASLVASAAFVLFGVLAAVTAAAPIFTAWSAPVNLGPTVNSAAGEAGSALSPDGLSLFFYSTRPDSNGQNNIYVSQRATLSDPWGVPVNVGATINSGGAALPALSSDGHWMFFSSGRTGGFGGADLWQSYRPDIHDDFGWQTPTNLGANVNTAAAENGNGYFDNGGSPQLFFGSDRLGPTGSADLYVTNRQPDGSWGVATRIPELSSTGTDNRPTLRQDGLEIFFYSDRAGGVGATDLWTSTRATVDALWSTPVDLGATVNSTAGDIHPTLSADALTMIFSSTRTGGFGGADLYVMTRTQIFPTTKDECKDGGFERFGIFKNQGDCVSYVATGGENQPG
jgi:hypothetical protein